MKRQNLWSKNKINNIHEGTNLVELRILKLDQGAEGNKHFNFKVNKMMGHIDLNKIQNESHHCFIFNYTNGYPFKISIIDS